MGSELNIGKFYYQKDDGTLKELSYNTNLITLESSEPIDYDYLSFLKEKAEKTIEIIFKHCTRKRFVKLIMGYYEFPKKKAEQIANDVREKRGFYSKLDAVLYKTEFRRGEK